MNELIHVLDTSSKPLAPAPTQHENHSILFSTIFYAWIQKLGKRTTADNTSHAICTYVLWFVLLCYNTSSAICTCVLWFVLLCYNTSSAICTCVLWFVLLWYIIRSWRVHAPQSLMLSMVAFNTLRPKQNGRHFIWWHFQMRFLKWKCLHFN